MDLFSHFIFPVYFLYCLMTLYLILLKGEIEASPDHDLVVDVIEHIDRHGEPGIFNTHKQKWCNICVL